VPVEVLRLDGERDGTECWFDHVRIPF
jgi:hypothetical protein